MNWFAAAVLLALVGCQADTPYTETVALHARVDQLEERINVLDRRLDNVAKGQEEPVATALPDDAPGGTVEVQGNARKVVLVREDQRIPVPGRVPEGDWTIRAAFKGTRLDDAGTVNVVVDETVTLLCTRNDLSCTATAN